MAEMQDSNNRQSALLQEQVKTYMQENEELQSMPDPNQVGIASQQAEDADQA